MGIAVLEVAPPASVNRAPQRSSRGAGIGRHKAKKALEKDLREALQAAGVPKPIPGGRVRATAELLFPDGGRRRDEGNYRAPLEKALGDALQPPPLTPQERALGIKPGVGHLADDTPDTFTFGAVTFGQTEIAEWRADGKLVRRRRPAVALIRLVWGDELLAELERELLEQSAGDQALRAIAAHRRAIEAAGEIRVADEESARRGKIKHAADRRLWALIDEANR